MKDWMQLSLAATVAALVGLASAFVNASPTRSQAAVPDTALTELRTTLEALRAEQARLGERLAALPAAPAVSPPQREAVVDLDQAIAAYMAKELATPAATVDGERPQRGVDQALVEQILSGELSGDELDALWQRMRDDGTIDAVLAEIERRVERSPNDPDLQNEVGKAYLQKLFDVGIGPMAGMWGEKADQAFDRALELDGEHWEARFQKALALSNWPAFLGKQGEAVRHFEILAEQQERRAPADEQAYTYTFLGNLYDQMGEREKALATWKRGATRFPEHEELRKKSEGP